jgi:hypothetical protein
MSDKIDKSHEARRPDVRRPWLNCDALGYPKDVGDEEWTKMLGGRAARGEGYAVPCPDGTTCRIAYAHRHVVMAGDVVAERLY